MADITLLKLIKSCAYFGDQEFILYKSRNKNFYRLGTVSADENNLGKLIVNDTRFVKQLLTECFKIKIPSMPSAQVRVIHRRRGADVGEHIKDITGLVRKYGLNGVAKYYGKEVAPIPFPKGVTLPD